MTAQRPLAYIIHLVIFLKKIEDSIIKHCDESSFHICSRE